MPQNVLQSLKKQCNPLLKKSFKERNPDVDMDEIQNNPNVPEDVKAAITGAMSLTLDEDDEAEIETGEDELPPVESLETFDDDYIMDASEDDGKKNRRKRIDENDEDWLTGRRKVGKPKKSKRKKKRSKSRVENDNGSGKQTGDKEKVKKKRSRKSNDTNISMNSTISSNVNSILESTITNSTLNSTITSTIGCENLNGTQDSMTNGTINSSGYDSMHKEQNKQKKAPKKRDNLDKLVNGNIKKTVRRQFTSLSAIDACIESVVQGWDVSIPESSSEMAIKPEPNENHELFKVPEPFMPATTMTPIKQETDTIDNDTAKKMMPPIKTEPKKKSRRKSTTATKSKEATQMDHKMDQTILGSKPIIKTAQTNGTVPKATRTSMKKVKFLS